MMMHNPPHPGEFIHDTYMAPHGISRRQLASSLGVATSTLSRVLNGHSAVSPEMALRLAKALGRSPESWLAMQLSRDLWVARNTLDLTNVSELRFAEAAVAC